MLHSHRRKAWKQSAFQAFNIKARTKRVPRLPPGGSSRRSRVKEPAVPECYYILCIKAYICMLRTKSFLCLFPSQDVSLGLRWLLPSAYGRHLPPGGRLGTGHRSEGNLGHSSVLTRRGSRTGKKGAPINKFTACPIRSKPFSLFIFLSKCCITPNYTQGAFGPAKICRRSKRTAKRKKSAYTRR